MAIPFSSARLSALVHATEDESKVVAAFAPLLPKGVELKRTKLKGHYGNPIVALEVLLKNRRLVREVWQNVLSRLPPAELDRLRAVAARKIDDSCHLYLRFDKQRAHRGELALSEGGDVVHVKFKVAVYPPEPEKAIELVRRLLGEEAEAEVHSV